MEKDISIIPFIQALCEGFSRAMVLIATQWSTDGPVMTSGLCRLAGRHAKTQCTQFIAYAGNQVIVYSVVRTYGIEERIWDLGCERCDV